MKCWHVYVAAVILLLTGMAGGCSIPEEAPATAPTAPVAFTDRDRQLILDFYGKYEFPPEVADPSVIAPDLEARLEASATVPPDVAGVPLPVQLEKQLSPLPPGYVRYRAGSAVILMDIRTREVIDQVQVQFLGGAG